MKQRILCLLLASLMLLPFASCAAPEAPADGTVTDTVAGETAADVDITPDIPKRDYGGETFRMIGMNEPGTWYYAEEYIGESGNTHVLNNTVYEMNTMVEDHLGVQVEYEYADKIVTGGEIFDIVSPTIMSGDDDYQLCILHPYYSYNSFIARNYVLDFYELEALDLEKPYWNKEVVDQLSINGRAYIALGDLCRYNLNILYCNKNRLSDAGRTVPYDQVRNQAWTLDVFTTLTAGMYEDTNGNGQQDNGDVFGFASLWDANGSAFMQASDIYVVTRNTDTDVFELSIYGERLTNMYDKLLRWAKDNSTYMWSYGNGSNTQVTIDFHTGQMAFTLQALGTDYLDADFEVGILPLPKYDVAQEDYCHVNWGNNIVVPTTVKDKVMVGEVLEMMAYYSRTHVQQIYYDEILQLRVSDAPDDREMVELIHSTVVFDPGIAYCDGYSSLWNLVYLPTFNILDKKDSISNYYKKNERGANSALKTLFKTVK